MRSRGSGGRSGLPVPRVGSASKYGTAPGRAPRRGCCIGTGSVVRGRGTSTFTGSVERDRGTVTATGPVRRGLGTETGCTVERSRTETEACGATGVANLSRAVCTLTVRSTRRVPRSTLRFATPVSLPRCPRPVPATTSGFWPVPVPTSRPRPDRECPSLQSRPRRRRGLGTRRRFGCARRRVRGTCARGGRALWRFAFSPRVLQKVVQPLQSDRHEHRIVEAESRL